MAIHTVNSLRYIGPGAASVANWFRDQFVPAPSKNEWGVDTLLREMRGPSGDLYRQFINGLEQGDQFEFNNNVFYLQTWQEIADPVFPGARLSYKGLTNGFPDESQSGSRVQLTGSTSASDLNVSWQGKTIVAASKSVSYVAPQVTYRYISEGIPENNRFSAIEGSIVVRHSETSVSFSDGTSAPFAGSAPAGVATALAGSPAPFNDGPSYTPIHGTPYYECEETVQLRLPGS